MKKYQWWTILGLGGACVTAALLGQTVMGQPGPKDMGVVVAPILIEKKATAAKPAPQTLRIPAPSQQLPPADLPTLQPTPKIEKAPEPFTGIQPPSAPALQDPPSFPPILSPETGGIMKTQALAPASNPASNSDVPLDVKPGKQQPSISVEWVGPSNTRVNHPVACQILVRNTSTTPAHNVVVKHRLAKDVTCKTTEPRAAIAGDELSWNLGTLAPNQARRLDLTLLTKSRGSMTCHATVTFTSVAAHVVQVREPMLAVKMRGPEKVVAGENVTFLFALSNPGDGVAESVRIRTTLSDGLEHPSGKKVIEFDVGTLAPKEIKTLQLACVARAGGEQKCTATLIGEGGLSASDAAAFSVLVPKLVVVISGPKLRYLDRHAVYVLKITNPGTATASAVVLNELVPAGFKFHQANQGGQFTESTRLVSWKLGDLQPGQSKEVAVDLVATGPGEHRLIAQASGANGLKSENDARTVVEGLPSLAIEVGHLDDPIEVGAETAYEIRIANTGTKTETNVELVCTLPDQLQLKGAKCSTTLRFRQEGSDLIFEPLARLAPRADVIYKVYVRGIAPGDVRFRTRIKSDGQREPVIRDESMRIYNDDTLLKRVSDVVPVAPPAIVPAPSPKEPKSKPITLPGPALPVVPPAPDAEVKAPISLPVAPKDEVGPISPPVMAPVLPKTGLDLPMPGLLPELPTAPPIAAPEKNEFSLPPAKIVLPTAPKTSEAPAPVVVPAPAPVPPPAATTGGVLPHEIPLPAPKK